MINSHRGTSPSPYPPPRRHGIVLNKIDLAATVIAALGIFMLGLVTVALAIVEAAGLISVLCTKSNASWLLAIFGLAVVWVIVRWKKMCVF